MTRHNTIVFSLVFFATGITGLSAQDLGADRERADCSYRGGTWIGDGYSGYCAFPEPGSNSGNPYGSVARSANTRKLGIAASASKAGADQLALQYCREREYGRGTQDCKIVQRFQNQCVLFTADKNEENFALRGSEADVQRALNDCNERAATWSDVWSCNAELRCAR